MHQPDRPDCYHRCYSVDLICMCRRHPHVSSKRTNVSTCKHQTYAHGRRGELLKGFIGCSSTHDQLALRVPEAARMAGHAPSPYKSLSSYKEQRNGSRACERCFRASKLPGTRGMRAWAAVRQPRRQRTTCTGSGLLDVIQPDAAR
jgi:hypothetical protein